MSDTTRGVALLLSVLLWSPVTPGLLSGSTSAVQALLVYAGALLLALVGCSLLAVLVRAYSPGENAAPEAAPAGMSDMALAAGDVPLRRAQDAELPG